MPATPLSSAAAGSAIPEWIEALRQSLQSPLPQPHHAVIETHISWVILAGDFAYKIKKPVKLDFLDYSTLESRHRYCDAEVTLNRRFAPQIYLDVLPIRDSPQGPHLGDIGPVIDYAVRMRRFEQSAMASHCLDAGVLTATHLETLAVHLAEIHQNGTRVALGSPWGSAETIHASAMENFATLDAVLPEHRERDLLGSLREWTLRTSLAHWPLFASRQSSGRVRECHGDLHLGNLVLLDDRLVPFDGIDFDPALRWIDVMSEAAFLMMDLADHGRGDLAWHFLNAYIDHTGDHEGLALLRFYMVYRAMVRSKVHALRAQQPHVAPAERDSLLCAAHGYLALASRLAHAGQPILVLTHGLSGSGKSAVAHAVAGHLNAVRLRSDVERKRLAGLNATQSSGSALHGGIYAAHRTQSLYARLADLARNSLAAGWPVVVDATFLKHSQRECFRQVAAALAVPCMLIALCAKPAELQARIARRKALGKDASEADHAVLAAQRVEQEPLTAEESRQSIVIDTGRHSTKETAAHAVSAVGRLLRSLATQDPMAE